MPLKPNPVCRFDRLGDQWVVLDPGGSEVLVLDGLAARCFDRIHAGEPTLPDALHAPAEVLLARGLVVPDDGQQLRWTRRRTLQVGLAAAVGLTVVGLPRAAAAQSVLFTSLGFGGIQTPTGGEQGDPVVVTIGEATYGIHVYVASDLSVESATSFSVNPVLTNLSIDCYLLGGGGGGGGSETTVTTLAVGAGGGGAGGRVRLNAVTLTDKTFGAYTVLTGNAGPGGPGGAVTTGTQGRGSAGASSSIIGTGVPGTAVASGGGGGGGSSALTGANGASGGGGAGRTTTANAGGTGVSGQGFAGGTGVGNNNNNLSGGGGGGFAAVGTDAVNNTSAGNGGAGATGADSLGAFVGTANLATLTTAIGDAVTLQDTVAGGGGGGCTTPGTGTNGGGNGGNNTTTLPTAGVHGTGGGGGGGRVHAGARGGSGLVVIRYLIT